MKFNKEEFLDSALGKRLQLILETWNKAYYSKDEKSIKICTVQWIVYQDVFRMFYKKEVDTKKTYDFFGVVLKGKKDDKWLIRLDRSGIITDRHYTNKDKKCECGLCEYEKICPYVQKSQRMPETSGFCSDLGLCWKLKKESE